MASENSILDTSIDTVVTTTNPEVTGSGHTMREGFSFDSFLKKMDLSRENLLEIALYFGLGIFFGFFVKKYHNYLLILVLFLIALAIADYAHIITIAINTEKIESLLGCQTVPCDVTFFSFGLQVIKEHVRATVSFISGFVIGLWVG